MRLQLLEQEETPPCVDVPERIVEKDAATGSSVGE